MSEISKCCKAEMRVEGSKDFGDGDPEDVSTCYNVCTKCEKPCDRFVEENEQKCIGKSDQSSTFDCYSPCHIEELPHPKRHCEHCVEFKLQPSPRLEEWEKLKYILCEIIVNTACFNVMGEDKATELLNKINEL